MIMDVDLNGDPYVLDSAFGEVHQITLPTSPEYKEPSEDDIPKVFFVGKAPTTKAEDELPLVMEYHSKTLSFKDYVTLKVQGDTSAGYPKKNFNLKMFSDADRTEKDKRIFRDWSKTHKYCLKANWVDHTHARNVVNGRLWGQIAKTRADYDSYPEQFRESANCGVVDGFPIKVYLNGVYQGIYTWNIRKDESMFNMDDSTGTQAALIADNGNPVTLWRSMPQINGGDWTDELNDVVPDAILTSFRNLYDFVMNSTDEEFVANIEQYIYKSSLIDYFIFIYCSLMFGGLYKSQRMDTYGGKWLANIYDMDATWALHWNGESYYPVTTACPSEYSATVESGGSSNLLYDRVADLFREEIKARYAELRETVLSDANIINEFERFMDVIPPYLYDEDFAQTTAGGAFVNIPSKDTNHIQKLRAIIAERMAYCDTMIPKLGEPVISFVDGTAYTWRQGGVAGDGSVNSNMNRIVTVNMLDASVKQIFATDGYEICLVCYNADGSYAGFWSDLLLMPITTAIQVPDVFKKRWDMTASALGGYSVKVMVKKSDGGNLTPDEVSNITFYMTAFAKWEHGSNYSDDMAGTTQNRIRTIGIIGEDVSTVTAATGYKIGIFCNTGTGGYVLYGNDIGGFWRQTADINAIRSDGYDYIRIIAKRDDGANMELSEGDNIFFS